MPVTPLDTLEPRIATVGFGFLGRNGDLGYEGKRVIVCARPYDSALSTHGPARLVFQLGGRFRRFCSTVAFNDDVPTGYCQADFHVLADGREVAVARHVVAGMPPHSLSADIESADTLELLVTTDRWEYCHAVWLAPELEPNENASIVLVDCLGRTEIALPQPRPRARRCIATIASTTFAPLLDDMFGSLLANGGCHDAFLVVLALDDGAECHRVAAKYGAFVVPCRSRLRVNVATKAALYSIARAVDANQFLCLDADLLILDDLRPVFSALDACRHGSILACGEGNGDGFDDLGHALQAIYGGSDADIERLLGKSSDAARYPLVVNDGVFAGSHDALLALDATIRYMHGASEWLDERPDISWRNQFVFNLALAQLRCGVELDATYNVQLHVQDATLRAQKGRIRGIWQDRSVRVLHFGGAGRRKYPEWRGCYSRVPDPLLGSSSGDLYETFLAALRSWMGQRGLGALAWSFYGTTDARTGRVSDPGAMPLLGLLHFLIRSNGCVRVLESGTGRGVSAACLASAVAHREGARVVTFDPFECAGRAELWETLPDEISSCIELRVSGSIEGMSAALAAGERYDAALLDSLHTAEHVWAEFELARRLVSSGGLILIHDPRWVHGTVEHALRQIQQAGYGVARLWTAETGVREDDNLGLAVIENRRYE